MLPSKSLYKALKSLYLDLFFLNPTEMRVYLKKRERQIQYNGMGCMKKKKKKKNKKKSTDENHHMDELDIHEVDGEQTVNT